MSARPASIGPAAGALAAAAGARLGESGGASSGSALLAVGVAALGAAWYARRAPRVVLATLGVALLGAGTMQRALDGQETSPLSAAVSAGRSGVVAGELAGDPTGPRFRTDALVRVSTFTPEDGSAGLAGGGRLLVARAADDSGRLRVLTAGDRVVLRGRLAALGEHDSRWRWRHAVGRIDDVAIEAFTPARAPLPALANRLRGVVERGARALPATDGALLVGFLLGDTRAVPGDVVADFRRSGLTHLLAVSGANVAFVLAVAGPVLRRLRLGLRAAAGVGVILVFAAMTRFEPSVLRASVMAAIAMGAAWVGRPVEPARLLAYAVTILVLVDPFLVHSIAFALSVGASAGIVAWSGGLARHLRGPRLVREPLAVTLAAQAGVAPVLIPAFGAMPAVAPLANLAAAPAAEPLTVYGLLATAAAWLVPPAAPLLLAPAGLLVAWVRLVADVAARAPGALGGRDLLVVAAAGVVVAGAARRARRRRRPRR